MKTCCEHDLRERIEILAKLAFSISIIVFNMMKFLVIPFIKKLTAQINIFKYVCTIVSCSHKWHKVLQQKKKKKKNVKNLEKFLVSITHFCRFMKK